MDKEAVVTWLNSLTDKQFLDFFYGHLAPRHIYHGQEAYLKSRLVLANASSSMDDNDKWSSWDLELLCPSATGNWDDSKAVDEHGSHCGLPTVSYDKRSICPICGGAVYGT